MILKPFQIQVLEKIRNSKTVHLLCIAPTGSGKGVIIEQLARTEKILLITPLIALGRQQKQRFERNGIAAHCSLGLNGSIDPGPFTQTQVWIISPESLKRTKNTDALRTRWKPSLIVIDECHCIEEWGDDFRPTYSFIPEWINRIDTPKTLWLSATLTHRGMELIESQLNTPLTKIGSFKLPQSLDLTFKKLHKSKRLDDLIYSLKDWQSSGVIFVATRLQVRRLALLLKTMGYPAYGYHSGISQEEKLHIERSLEAKIPMIVIATSAFGMGMDYPHLKWAVIYELSFSLLSLTQSIGRVGRANDSCAVCVYWDQEEFENPMYRSNQIKVLRQVLEKTTTAQQFAERLREVLV